MLPTWRGDVDRLERTQRSILAGMLSSRARTGKISLLHYPRVPNMTTRQETLRASRRMYVRSLPADNTFASREALEARWVRKSARSCFKSIGKKTGPLDLLLREIDAPIKLSKPGEAQLRKTLIAPLRYCARHRKKFLKLGGTDL